MGGGKARVCCGDRIKDPTCQDKEKCTLMRAHRLWLQLLTVDILHCLREDMKKRGRVGAISDDNQARIERGRLSNEYIIHADSFYTLLLCSHYVVDT